MIQNSGVREHLGRRVVAPRLPNGCRRARHRLAGRGRPQHLRDEHDDEALSEAEPQESGFVPARLNHVGNRHDRQGRAGAEARRRQSRGEATPVGKPFQRVADRSAVNHARADAANRGAEVQQEQRVSHRVDDPCDAHEHAAAGDHDPRTKPVDQVAFDRDEPGLRQHEDREGELNRGAAPVVFLIDRPDEQRPPVLQIRDHDHADDAEEQLSPARRHVSPY